MYMNVRWKHDHEYFQRMIKWKQSEDGWNEPTQQEIIPGDTNENVLVGAIITNMREFLEGQSLQ